MSRVCLVSLQTCGMAMYLVLLWPRGAPRHCLLVRLLRKTSGADVASWRAFVPDFGCHTAALRLLAAVKWSLAGILRPMARTNPALIK